MAELNLESLKPEGCAAHFITDNTRDLGSHFQRHSALIICGDRNVEVITDVNDDFFEEGLKNIKRKVASACLAQCTNCPNFDRESVVAGGAEA